MTDTFLSGGENLDEFLEQYHEKRKLAHLRRVKVGHYLYTLVWEIPNCQTELSPPALKRNLTVFQVDID